jgi:signal transduction histidine kinase
MSHSIQFHNHPFRFLLYLEWALLAITISSLLTPAPRLLSGPLGPPGSGAPPLPQFPLLSLVSIFGFGLLGLYLPTGRLLPRLGHTLLQVLLVSLTSLLGFTSGRLFPVMYLVLVIRSCFMFGLMGRVVLTGLSFFLFLTILQWRIQLLTTNLPDRVAQRLQGFLTNVQLNLVFLFGLALVFVLLLVNALLTERQSQESLKKANAQLRQSADEIERLAMAQERSRIAREIHDSLGHSLTALNLQLEGALKLAQRNPEQAQRFLTEAKRLGSVALNDVRESVATLRSDPLRGQSLQTALSTLVNHFQQSTGIKPEVNLQPTPTLPVNVSTVFYRIVQEGLTNIVKHAKATQVKLDLRCQAQTVSLTLEDNGQGFTPSQTSTGYGLQGIRERTAAIGGNFHLQSQPGQGCRLQVVLSLSDNPYDSSFPG